LSDKKKAVALYAAGLSYRAIGALVQVSHVSVQKWLERYIPEWCPLPEPESRRPVILELDEMWHFLQKKTDKLWVWKALDKFSGRLVGWVCGDRDAATLKRLLARLAPWKVLFYHTDGLESYAAVLAEDRHYQGKDETDAVERNNSRQRHWLARFRRKTCVVSRKQENVDLAIQCFAAFHVNKNAKIQMLV
jgi:insertion element IS1 protein InsB